MLDFQNSICTTISVVFCEETNVIKSEYLNVSVKSVNIYQADYFFD